MTNYTTGHILNFKQFFKISAFFIAFILFYAITVPIIMWFANKDFKVISGLLYSMRKKAYSNLTVKHRPLLIYLVDQNPVHPMDLVRNCDSICLAHCMGNAPCVGPHVQQLVRHWHILDRYLRVIRVFGVR